jgi:sigma-B regulation protein RsbQ
MGERTTACSAAASSSAAGRAMLAPMMVTSSDGTEIYIEITGSSDTALVFAHGWMGNVRWWDAQRDAFAATHQIVTLDLGNHGRSGRRTQCSAQGYANDIAAAARASAAARIVLVGHSMAGAYALLASPDVERLAAVILVDTLKDLDATPPPEQLDSLLATYRADFPGAVADLMPRYLFTPQTPPAIVERLTREFLTVPGETAAALMEPYYRFDVREAARRVAVPVRGIGTDLHPHNLETNRAYYRDYAYVTLAGYGHYPMLEAPDAFNAELRAQLTQLGG